MIELMVRKSKEREILNLSNINGLVCWNEQEIELREDFIRRITSSLRYELLNINPAFQLYRIETPLLCQWYNIDYNFNNMFFANELALRPETTKGCYEYALAMLDHKWDLAGKLPMVVWQAGKSFRNEQDQVVKNMRLKEFYQLEYQVLYSDKTANDYPLLLHTAISQILYQNWGMVTTLEVSDRLPAYSDETMDLVDGGTGLEVCSMSRRHDFPKEGVKCFEISIGLDRLVYTRNPKGEGR